MCFAAQASPGLLSLRGATRSWPTALGPDGSACFFSWWWSSTKSRGARNPSGLQGWRCAAGHSASLDQGLANSVPMRWALRRVACGPASTLWVVAMIALACGGPVQTDLRHSGLTDRKTPTDPLRSYKGPKRSGRWVAAAAGFRGLLIPVKKSGFGAQSFDLIKFFGGGDGQNIPRCPAYPAGSAAYIALGALSV